MRQHVDPQTVADCPQAIRFREVPRWIETGSGNHVLAGYDHPKATYCWLFSVDQHGQVGRRYINADNSPFGPVDEEDSPQVGYLMKIDPWNGHVKYAEGGSPCPVTQARLDAWIEAEILVDPNLGG